MVITWVSNSRASTPSHGVQRMWQACFPRTYVAECFGPFAVLDEFMIHVVMA